MKTVLEDFFSTLKSDTTLKNLLGGTTTNSKIFPIIPKNYEAFPCLTYQVWDEDSQSIPIGSGELVIEYRAYGKDKTVCENIIERVKELLQYRQNWDKNIVWSRYSGGLDLPEEDRNLWSRIMRVRVWVKKS